MKKICSCSIFKKSLVISVSLFIWAVGSIGASASDFEIDGSTYTFNMDRWSTDQDVAFLQVIVSDNGDGTLNFKVSQPDDIFYGDLRGIFFHVNDLIDVTQLDFTFVTGLENLESGGGVITDPLVLSYEAEEGNINDTLDNSNTVNPLGPYDVGLQFGLGGIGISQQTGENSYDIKSIEFNVSYIGDLSTSFFFDTNLEDIMAGRVMSLWDADHTSRDLSSKLNCCDDVTVPEPSSTMGLLAFAVGGLLWRRRISARP